MNKLAAGTWIQKFDANSVVLPLSLFDGVDEKPADLVGQSITLRLKKKARGSDADPEINVDCRVAGVVAGEVGYLQDQLAKNIDLWHQGKIKYTARQGFISGEDIQKSDGQYSCKVLVADISNVASVVAYLRSLGYDTEDSLGGQEHVNRLGRVLMFFVSLLVIGGGTGAFVAVVINMIMNTKSNIYEPAGIYPSLGGTKTLTIEIFTLQGIVLGVSSFAIAAPSSWAAIKVVKILVEYGFSFDIDQIAVNSIFSVHFWWLHLVAFAVSLGFCLIGAWISAGLVCKTSIADAFSSKDQ